jgi:hypothetical protein
MTENKEYQQKYFECQPTESLAKYSITTLKEDETEVDHR